MNPNEYQKLAQRTECDQEKSRINYLTWQPDRLLPIRLNHAVIGMTGEVGELASTMQKWLHYGQPLDKVNVEEELGDLLWYVALACNALGVSMESVMEKNIAKLKKRYPDKYTEELAREENRNRESERRALENLDKADNILKGIVQTESTTHGWNACEEMGHDWELVQNSFRNFNKCKRCEKVTNVAIDTTVQDKGEMTDPYYE